MEPQKPWKEYNTKGIISNIEKVFKLRDINQLSKASYDFLYQLSGFIAHYNQGGFMCHYTDLRLLIEDLKDCSDLSRPEYYAGEFFTGPEHQRAFYLSKTATLKALNPLVEKYEIEIYESFSEQERRQDLSTIQALKAKHNITEAI